MISNERLIAKIRTQTNITGKEGFISNSFNSINSLVLLVMFSFANRNEAIRKRIRDLHAKK